MQGEPLYALQRERPDEVIQVSDCIDLVVTTRSPAKSEVPLLTSKASNTEQVPTRVLTHTECPFVSKVPQEALNPTIDLCCIHLNTLLQVQSRTSLDGSVNWHHDRT